MKAIPLAVLLASFIFPASAGDGEVSAGIASWYGYPYHGRRAANGEVYDMEELTAAHPTLPFGTRVRVVNLRNERSVEVRITDRGPFIDGRIIDLSRAAARAVDMIMPGIIPVRLEIIGALPNTPAGRFAAQVGAFQDRQNAEHCLALMVSRYGSGHIVIRDGDPVFWRVLVGSEPTLKSAHLLAVRIRRESVQPAAFITRLDP